MSNIVHIKILKNKLCSLGWWRSWTGPIVISNGTVPQARLYHSTSGHNKFDQDVNNQLLHLAFIKRSKYCKYSLIADISKTPINKKINRNYRRLMIKSGNYNILMKNTHLWKLMFYISFSTPEVQNVKKLCIIQKLTVAKLVF